MRKGKIIYLLATLLLLTVVFSVHPRAEAKTDAQKEVIVPLMNAKNEQAGQAVLTETAQGVRIALDAEGLRPGIHAIHFHEIGVCTPPDFLSSGNDFNPYGKHHGLKNKGGPHAGDMPNVFADSHGRIHTVLFNPRVTLDEARENSLRDADGSALIIYEFGDDQQSDPSGDAGARILCGIIK